MIGHLCTDLFTDAECDPNSFPADDVMAVHRTPSHDGRLYIKPINLGFCWLIANWGPMLRKSLARAGWIDR